MALKVTPEEARGHQGRPLGKTTARATAWAYAKMHMQRAFLFVGPVLRSFAGTLALRATAASTARTHCALSGHGESHLLMLRSPCYPAIGAIAS